MDKSQPVQLKNLSLEELESFVVSLGEKPFRAAQLAGWLYGRGARSFAEMTSLAKSFREKLSAVAEVSFLEPAKAVASADGTKKFRFLLKDGEAIESVLLPERGHLTLCISTQAGCALGCRFCVTGSRGLRRDLEPCEILDQVIGVKAALSPGEKLTNLVLMGMGEPLNNFARVRRALEILRSSRGLQFSHRRITVSTAGIIPRMAELCARPNFVKLAVSLNASSDAQRSELMPVNRKYPLRELLDCCRRLPLAHRERITFEYVLLKGVNDSEEDARRVARLLQGIPAKVNLIPFNEHPGIPFRRPAESAVQRFQQILISAGFLTIVRQSKGAEIHAACGQLGGAVQGF